MMSLLVGYGLFASESQKLLSSYSSLHRALAGDKITEAQSLAEKANTELLAHLKSAASPSESLIKMQAGAQALNQSKTDEEYRKAFGVYSEGATGLVREHEGLKSKWQLFYCPMVPKGIFGYWIQPKPEKLLNPYYGAKMLTCGVKRPW